MAEQAYHTDNEYTLEGLPINKVRTFPSYLVLRELIVLYALWDTQITVIAQVRSVMVQTTSNMYKLVDGSGEIEARHSVEPRGSEDTHASQSTL
jgi:hypothetical protein